MIFLPFVFGALINSDIISLLGTVVLFWWIFSIGMFFGGDQNGRTLFKVAIIYIIVYPIFVKFFLLILEGFSAEIWLLFIPLHFLAMGSVIYAILCASSALAAQTKEAKGIAPALKYFLLIAFFPFTIWTLQPEINRLSRESFNPTY